jgi:Tol biopolymer transport system component
VKAGKWSFVLGSVALLSLFSARIGQPGDAVSAATGTAASACVCSAGTNTTTDGLHPENSAATAVTSSVVLSGATGTCPCTAEAKKPEPLEPQFVRPLGKIEAGRNDSNPVWSPLGTLIAFERSVGDKREIHIALQDGTPVQTVYFLLSEGGTEMKFFFPGVSEETSYNAGISWAPGEDRFVFMSNGGEGNYDLYLQDLGGQAATRLTNHKEKDGQAHWSPGADALVFVSGRTGSGDVYLLDVVTRALTRMTQGGKAYLYPQWSPDGRKLVMMHGSNENHNIVLVNDVAKPAESQKRLTAWAYDDLRPVWSPDGKKIAFYSNYNPAGDPRLWSIMVVAADGSDPAEGDALAAKVVAADVIPDVEVGPAWTPDSSRIIFVKNDRQEYNPLYVADIGRKTVTPVRTETKMNHDVSISTDETIAFRAQVDQWDQIYIMKLK